MNGGMTRDSHKSKRLQLAERNKSGLGSKPTSRNARRLAKKEAKKHEAKS